MFASEFQGINKTPQVTIVMPAYNASSQIRKSVDSVLAQTIEDWELIICDDGSTDDTAEIIRSYAKRDRRICYTAMPKNSGYARVPRLKAIQLATASWVCSIDSDDTVEPEYLEKLIKRQKKTGANIVLSKMCLVKGGEITKIIPNESFDIEQILPGKDAFLLTIGSWKIGGNGALIRKELYDSVVNDITNDMASDEVDFRILLSVAGAVAFSDACYNYIIYSTSVTRRLSPRYFTKTNSALRLLEYMIRNFPDNKDALNLQWKEAYNTLYESFLIFFYQKKYLQNHKGEILAMLNENLYRLRMYSSYNCNGMWLTRCLSHNSILVKSFAYTHYVVGKTLRVLKIK